MKYIKLRIILGFIIGYAGFLIYAGQAYAATYTFHYDENGGNAGFYYKDGQTGSYVVGYTGGTPIAAGTYYFSTSCPLMLTGHVNGNFWEGTYLNNGANVSNISSSSIYSITFPYDTYMFQSGGIGGSAMCDSNSGFNVYDWLYPPTGADLILSDTLAPPSSVSLAYPTSTTPDFSNWVVNWVNSGDLPYGTMEVAYGLSSTTLSYQDSVSFSPYISSNPLPISKHQPLWFIPLADPVTWYAQVLDIGATSTVFSNIISFQVSPSAAVPPASTSTNLASPFLGTGMGETSSTLANPTLNCQNTSSSFLADPLGNIQEGICNAMVFLFVPNSAQQQNLSYLFGNLKTTYGNKPPFGYITAIATPLQSFNVSSSLSWPALTNASTTAAFNPVYGIFDAGFAAIAYVLLGFWVFHRARKIEL